MSDNNLSGWGGSFQSAFQSSWVGNPPVRITLARYVIQWDETAFGLAPFEQWLANIANMRLTPELALTSYNGEYPVSSGSYRHALEVILIRARELGSPITYLEPWNEPNNQGKESAVAAAHFTNAANGACRSYGCTIVAGNFEDTSNVATYERQYVAALNPVPTIWGVHPYYAVKYHNTSHLASFKENLPNGGTGDQIWFTEVGAYYCQKGGSPRGESQQAQDASYLVNTLIPDPRWAPVHVFYYGFKYKTEEEPPCAKEDDTELYRASGQPRQAADVIDEGPAPTFGSRSVLQDVVAGEIWSDPWSGFKWG